MSSSIKIGDHSCNVVGVQSETVYDEIINALNTRDYSEAEKMLNDFSETKRISLFKYEGVYKLLLRACDYSGTQLRYTKSPLGKKSLYKNGIAIWAVAGGVNHHATLAIRKDKHIRVISTK